MISKHACTDKSAMQKIFQLLLWIRALTYDRSNNYWLEMSWLQVPFYDRKYYCKDCCPVYAEDKD
jgi:hypothetical protein